MLQIFTIECEFAHREEPIDVGVFVPVCCSPHRDPLLKLFVIEVMIQVKENRLLAFAPLPRHPKEGNIEKKIGDELIVSRLARISQNGYYPSVLLQKEVFVLFYGNICAAVLRCFFSMH